MVRRLRARGDLTSHHASIRAVGYRQLWAHLEGECSLDEAILRGIAATRQLAKRQLTWIRADAALERIDSQSEHALAQWIDQLRRRYATVTAS